MAAAAEKELLTRKQFGRLKNAVEYSREQLQVFRGQRTDALRQYAGHFYGDNEDSTQKIPLNLIELAVSIYTRQLVSDNPRVMVSTPKTELKPYTLDLELLTNQRIEKKRLAETIERAVVDAMMCMGIVKVCLVEDELTVDHISFDDWFHDVTARRWQDSQFFGHRFRVPIEDVKNNEDYDADARFAVMATDAPESGEDRAEQIGTGQPNRLDKSFRQMCELTEVYIPGDNLIVLFQEGGEWPLAVYEWEGAESGPYHMLGFQDVPDNIVPLAPVTLWRDLHEATNALLTKCIRQAERAKSVGTFNAANEEEAKRIRDAADGTLVQTTTPQSAVNEIRVGGMDGPTAAAAFQLRDLFSWAAGNLDSLGGLSPQSGTLGQDELLHGSASKRLETMQERVVKFAAGIVRDMVWYAWTDPVLDEMVTQRVDTAAGPVEMSWRVSPDSFTGDFFDYNFTVDPYSMQHKSPSGKLQQLLTIYGQIIAPSLPLMANQGTVVNYNALMRLIGRLSNITELDDILIYNGARPDSDVTTPSEAVATKPAATSRTYTRINKPGSTMQQKSAVFAQMMMGQNPQRAEAATIGRPTG